MSLRILYHYIVENYGVRGCWISDLANSLGICKRNAGYLTRSLGYCRGRAIEVTPFEVWAADEGVRAIYKTIETKID